MAAYRRVDDLRSPAGWLPVHRDQLRAQRVWESFTFTFLVFSKMWRAYWWLAYKAAADDNVLRWLCSQYLISYGDLSPLIIEASFDSSA